LASGSSPEESTDFVMAEDGGPREKSPMGQGVTLVGVAGTIDRLAGAEKAYWNISAGLRDSLGFGLVQASQLPPTHPLADSRELHVLRPHGRRSLLGLGQVFALRKLLIRVERPAILLPFQLNTNILSVIANSTLPRRLRLPVVVNDRANIRTMTRPNLDRGLGWALRVLTVRLMAGWCYRRARFVVCNSRANAEQVREFIGAPHPPVVAIPNPVNVEEIQARFPTRDRSRLGDPAAPVIAGHGRLFYGKGWETLIRVLGRVHEKFPGARLRLLGEGVQRPALEALAEAEGVRDYCDFEGFKSDPFPALESADVYVLASRSEGMPNSLLEAIALGLPCVSTDCPTGPAEILGRDGRVGRLVAVDAIDEMVAAIVELLTSGETRNALSQAARRRAEDFRLEVCVEAYADVLRDCLPGVSEPMVP
jgi:glycosyltransferase involved in cell wall biosynthesis